MRLCHQHLAEMKICALYCVAHRQHREPCAALDDVDRAERELHQARIVAERLYGPQHPETLDVRRLQAGLKVRQGQLAAAAAELRDVHDQTLAALGSEHRETGWSWHALGLLALEQGDAARAVEDMTQAVRIWRMPDSARLLPLGLYGLALAQQRAGAPEQALRALEEARQRLNLDAFLDSIACDYADVGRPVRFCPEARAGVVWIPPQALRRVMTNLIDNGLKFGATVTVALNRDATGDIIIHVLDEGPGIPEASLQAVLQPFFRLEDSRNRDTGGTGLGLAIAAQLVSQMNGTLRLANRPQGGLDASVRLAAQGLYPAVSPAQIEN